MNAGLWRQRWALCLAGLFLGSVVIRLIAWRVIPPSHYENPGMGDMYSFLSLGIGLATESGYVFFPSSYVQEVFEGTRFPSPHDLGDPTVFNKSPGYPAFLAAIFRIVGYDLSAVRLIQIVLGSLIPLLVFWLATQLFSRRVALVVSLLAACYYPYIFWSFVIMSESLRAILMLVMALAWLWAFRRPAMWRWALAGVASGAMLSVNAAPLLLVPLVAVVLLWQQRARFGWACAASVAFLLGIGLVLWPWAHYNHRLIGRWMVFPPYGGQQILWACDPDPAYFKIDRRGWMDWPDRSRSTAFMQLYRVADEEFGGIAFPEGPARELAKEFERDRIRFRRALVFMARHPLMILGSLPAKFWNVWRPEHPGAHPIRKLNSWLCYVLWVPWFLVGAWVVARRGTMAQRLILTVLLYHVAFYLVFSSELRYRVPVMALFFMVAAYGLMVAWERVRQFVPSQPVVLRTENRRAIA